MDRIDLTLGDPWADVAFDEALLIEAENSIASGESAGAGTSEVLRLWEPERVMVVVGRGSNVADEVHLEACQRRNIPIVRRVSGGAAVVTGPGCLMYALVLSRTARRELTGIEAVHRWTLGRLAVELRRHGIAAERCGISDLAVAGRKFSGNSLRCRQTHYLYHGTLLYRFDLSLIEELLPMPPRRPEYRGERRHVDFLMNLPIDGAELREIIASAFDALGNRTKQPITLTQELVRQRYADPKWNC